MPEHTGQCEDLDRVWRALASPVRRRMLDILAERPITTGDLSTYFGDLSRFAVMQHLKVLEAGDLVTVTRTGRHRFNHLNPVPIQQIHDRWINRYRQHWAETLLDLKTTVESSNRTHRSEPRAG